LKLTLADDDLKSMIISAVNAATRHELGDETMKTRTNSTAKRQMTQKQFFVWLNFFRDAEVVIGNGKPIWVIEGGKHSSDKGCVVFLSRMHQINKYNKPERVTYTCSETRLRLAD